MTHELLSPTGRHRRDEILSLVIHEAQRIKRRRTRRRIIACVTLVLLAALPIASRRADHLFSWRSTREMDETARQNAAESGQGHGVAQASTGTGSQQPVDPAAADRSKTADDTSVVEIVFVSSHVEDLDQYLVPTGDTIPPEMLLDDEQLLAALAEIGRPTGIARWQGRTWLTGELLATSE